MARSSRDRDFFAKDSSRMKTFKNSNAITVKNAAKPSDISPHPDAPKVGKYKIATRENMVVILFFLFWFMAFGWILYAFFPYVHYKANVYIGGQFKRPLPKDPEKYFDVACTNIHSYETFLQSNQAQLCHDARPLSRGPVFFGLGQPASGTRPKST